MGKMLVVAGASLAVALSMVASARASEIGYVTGSSVNCREEGSATSKIVKVLNRGDRALIVDRVAGWANLDLGEEACWVLAKYVGSQALAGADEANALKGALTASGRAKAKSSGAPRALAASSPVRKSAKRSPRASSGYAVGSCPCSGSRVCIGPRGGRYCITSGGNKRYGV